MKTWQEFRRTKAYDLIAGLPLILWFGYGMVTLGPIWRRTRARFCCSRII